MSEKFSQQFFEKSESFGRSEDQRLEFRDKVIKVLRGIYPHYIIRPESPGNPDAIFLGNKQDNVRMTLPTHDIFARFSQTARTDADLKDIILEHFADLLKLVEDANEIVILADAPWEKVKPNLYLSLTANFELEPNADSVLKNPFGTEVSICPMLRDPDKSKRVERITRKYFEKWGVTEEEVFQAAFENLSRETEEVPLIGVPPPHGHLRNEKSDGDGASAILLRGIREFIGETIGLPFRFGIPSRHFFFAWTELDDKNFQQEMKTMMTKEMNRMPSPLTDLIFEVDESLNIKQLKEL